MNALALTLALSILGSTADVTLEAGPSRAKLLDGRRDEVASMRRSSVALVIGSGVSFAVGGVFIGLAVQELSLRNQSPWYNNRAANSALLGAAAATFVIQGLVLLVSGSAKMATISEREEALSKQKEARLEAPAPTTLPSVAAVGWAFNL